MKKVRAQKENAKVVAKYYEFNETKLNCDWDDGVKLRHCKATVYTSERWYVLVSYSTIVAIIDRNTGVLYDVLRMTYGYTSTSSQHISKFSNDYSAKEKYTWREEK